MEYTTLNNGLKMPMLGFGVFQIPKEDTERIVLDAIEVGYRLFDTAQGYGNEKGLGSAIKKSGIPREDFFITFAKEITWAIKLVFFLSNLNCNYD